MPIPDKPSVEGLEHKWDSAWEELGTYRFDRSKDRGAVYAIDTPPPTVSGQLHLGTVFGYVQFDAMARYHRMTGKEVFFPMGWDDNGLPTERRVQNYYNVRCDPTVPYDDALDLSDRKGPPRQISRVNFIALCHGLTAEDEKDFEKVFRSVGMSVDWSLTYATIDDRSRQIAQRAFLHNVQRGEAYSAEAPTTWDVDFQTAIAQAEMEDRPTEGFAYRFAFATAAGEPVVIETTRPELLPACVAVVANPDDERWRPLVGTELVTPVFGVRVPVLVHHLADPDKGSGIAMICTFGDTTDVTWWRELRLPMRSIVQRDGRLRDELPDWLDTSAADAWRAVAGKTTKQARREIVELLRGAGALVGEPRPITHEVRYYEKGDRPLEIVTSRQWYIRNGANDPALRDALVDAGGTIDWHPDFMRVRFEHWVGGLNSDWLISRQRHFGVPFPVWYPMSADGSVLWDEAITADEASLPVDPQAEAPPGYDETQRGKPGGFVGDADVLDTWAVSSLTPEIAARGTDDPDLFSRVFPMDLRPQGPEIIRTWLFSTLLRSLFEHQQVPWKHASINGWILDPDRKKMSKSLGNVITPTALVERHGADGLRYWACSAAPGIDTAIDDGQMRVGRRLAIKLLNATRFALGLGTDPRYQQEINEPLDRAMLARLRSVVDGATASFEAYQYQQALERSERFFWDFCDDYLELVKMRAYEDDAASRSARGALALAISAVQRLLAPFLPFAAEEAWSWWQPGSIHRAPWPDGAELEPAIAGADPGVLDVASDVLREIRRAKSDAQRSMRTSVTTLCVTATAAQLTALRACERDLRAAGNVDVLLLDEGEPWRCKVTLAPADEQSAAKAPAP